MALKKIEAATYHVMFHHHKADGWITLAKKENGFWNQYHYQPQELAQELSKWLGEDIYFSQNTFYKPFRKIENIRQLRSLYVDVDCYLFNYLPDQILMQLEADFFGQSIPEPNLIIFSGRGIVLVWLIDPVPSKALPLWQAIQDYFTKELKALGGDAKAHDACRVFRVAGSVNSKNGAEVSVQYRHEHRYALRELQKEYLPELQPKKKAKGRPKKIHSLFNAYTLHHARLLDLIKLVELRNYDVKGYREIICFLYRYWSCCFLADPEEALQQTLELNSQFIAPLREREVISATRSAEKAWASENKAYNYKNATLIDLLDITDDEQTHLKTIIGRSEKQRRNTIAKRSQRRTDGVMERSKYLAREQDKTEDKLFLLKKAFRKYPNATQVELAKMLGITQPRVSQLLKQIKI